MARPRTPKAKTAGKPKPKRSHPLLDRALPMLQAAGETRARAMFGGFGIYLDDVFMGIVAWNRLFFRVGDRNRPDYSRAGSTPFTYEGRGGKPIEMPYWEVPGEVQADPERLCAWATKARNAALAARANKAKRGRSRAGARDDDEN